MIWCMPLPCLQHKYIMCTIHIGCCARCWFPQQAVSYASCSSRNTPYIVGANTEELAIVNLIAEQERIEPRPQKKLDSFLGEFRIVAFAIAPLYSTFLHQEDNVSCHPACLLMLHCLLSRRVVNGSMHLPQDRLRLLCEMAQAALHYRNFAHASPIQTTPSCALARMYARPYCPPSCSSCFFLR